MPRDILNEFGPDSPDRQQPRARNGGIPKFRDVMDYAPPQGPIGISRTGVGLGGSNCGNAGSQGKYSADGDGATGSPGLHGENIGRGTNRG